MNSASTSTTTVNRFAIGLLIVSLLVYVTQPLWSTALSHYTFDQRMKFDQAHEAEMATCAAQHPDQKDLTNVCPPPEMPETFWSSAAANIIGTSAQIGYIIALLILARGMYAWWRSKKFIGLAITFGIVGLAATLAFFTFTTNGWTAVSVLLTGIMFTGFILLLISARRPSAAAGTVDDRPAYIPFIWTLFFALGIQYLLNSGLSWTGSKGEVFAGATAFAVVMSLIAQVIPFVLMKYLTGWSWVEAIFGLGAITAHDERERAIAAKAAQATVITLVVVFTLLAVVVESVTPPGRYALMTLMSGLLMLTIGCRNFYAWKFGLR